MTSSIRVTEEMIEAGLIADNPLNCYVSSEARMAAIYLAMRAKEQRYDADAARERVNDIADRAVEKIAALSLPQGDVERLVKIAFEGAIWNCIMSRQMLDQDTTDEIITGAWEGFEEPFRAALVRPIGDDVREALPLLNKAFRTTTAGPSGYTMEFRFPDIETLHAADDEWHAHRKAEIARSAITSIGSQSID